MKKPNFIFIHSDQLRFDCLGVNHMRTGIYTPYIDSIAYQGINFTDAYATCPVCIPARLSLLTGQTHRVHGVAGNIGIPYMPLQNTLPEQLRKGGYQTALVGRGMHTYPSTYSYGFEYYMPGDPSSERKENGDPFFTYLKNNAPADEGGYYGNGIFNNSRAAGPYHLPDRFHHTKWTVNKALEFLDVRDQSRPFCLFVGFYAPHPPHNPPAEFFDRYYQRNDLNDPAIADYDVKPLDSGNVMSQYVNLEGEDLRAIRAGYYGNIAFMDNQIGRLINKVMMMRNTYIIFTSDHGELLGDHYLTQKQFAYEGSSHIPFMMMGPGIDNGSQSDEPISWHDIMPTMLDLADLPIPESVEGKSFKNILFGKQETIRDYLHGETMQHHFPGMKTPKPCRDGFNPVLEDGSHFLTDGHVKYIWYVTSGTEQFFDLDQDPKELHDLSAEKVEEVKKWRQILIHELAGREEGFSDGEKLIPGKKPVEASPKIKALIEQRKKEGFSIAYAGGPANPYNNLQFDENLLK